jgi:hypothetical protein
MTALTKSERPGDVSGPASANAREHAPVIVEHLGRVESSAGRSMPPSSARAHGRGDANEPLAIGEHAAQLRHPGELDRGPAPSPRPAGSMSAEQRQAPEQRAHGRHGASSAR